MLKAHPTLAFWIAAAVIALCVLVNLALYGSGVTSPTAYAPSRQELLDDPANRNPVTGERLPLPTNVGLSTDGTTTSSWPIVPLAVTLTVVVGGLGVFALVGRRLERAKRQRDEQRRQDLATIARAFEAYYREHNAYPIAMNTSSKYYTAVNFSRDWRFYGFASDEAMRAYLPDWPLCDPSVPAGRRDQANAYLYFPHDEGQRFDLYAHLEAPDKDAPDYNRNDALPRALGTYIYKVSGRSSPPRVLEDVLGPVPLV